MQAVRLIFFAGLREKRGPSWCRLTKVVELATGKSLLRFILIPIPGSASCRDPVKQRAVRDDPDLKGASYLGEIVISAASLYLVRPDGAVSELGETESLLPAGGQQ